MHFDSVDAAALVQALDRTLVKLAEMSSDIERGGALLGAEDTSVEIMGKLGMLASCPSLMVHRGVGIGALVAGGVDGCSDVVDAMDGLSAVRRRFSGAGVGSSCWFDVFRYIVKTTG